MNDLERQQKLDKLKKRMLEMSATIAEQEDEIALNERVLNMVLEDHVFHSPHESVQLIIETVKKRAEAQRNKDIEEKRRMKIYEYMFNSLLWKYVRRPCCYYCSYYQYCPQRKAEVKPDAETCMRYIEAREREIAKRRMVVEEQDGLQ